MHAAPRTACLDRTLSVTGRRSCVHAHGDPMSLGAVVPNERSCVDATRNPSHCWSTHAPCRIQLLLSGAAASAACRVSPVPPKEADPLHGRPDAGDYLAVVPNGSGGHRQLFAPEITWEQIAAAPNGDLLQDSADRFSLNLDPPKRCVRILAEDLGVFVAFTE